MSVSHLFTQEARISSLHFWGKFPEISGTNAIVGVTHVVSPLAPLVGGCSCLRVFVLFDPFILYSLVDMKALVYIGVSKLRSRELIQILQPATAYGY